MGAELSDVYCIKADCLQMKVRHITLDQNNPSLREEGLPLKNLKAEKGFLHCILYFYHLLLRIPQ